MNISLAVIDETCINYFIPIGISVTNAEKIISLHISLVFFFFFF